LIIVALVGVAGCASGGARSKPLSRNQKSSASIITEKEISDSPGRTAYDTIEYLRPLFLSVSRARGSLAERWVYVDGMRVGGLDALRGIRSSTIREIRLLDASEATLQFGSGHSLGAVLVLTRNGR
jgi:hypothetical protein